MNGGPLGNDKAVKHGGAGAMQRIHDGKPLIGVAREEELRVQAEYEAVGQAPIELRTVQQLQAAANLYWGAASKAAEDSDLQATDRYIQRFGWIAGLALRGWAEIRKREGDGNRLALGASIIEVMNKYEKDKSE